MRRIGVAIVGLLCLVAAAVQAEDGGRFIPVKFIAIEGGKLMMGSGNKRPLQEVAVKSFEISETLVTVEQYATCVAKRQCKTPETGNYCNWGKKGRRRHPINCVGWEDADDFAKFMQARLPSEAEYEFAATGRGRYRPYPWGKEPATCRKAVMLGDGGYGCGRDSTMPVCSKPEGNTELGLCDMAGNVWEWTQDSWHDPSAKAQRGGSFANEADQLRVDARRGGDPAYRGAGRVGFRLARSLR